MTPNNYHPLVSHKWTSRKNIANYCKTVENMWEDTWSLIKIMASLVNLSKNYSSNSSACCHKITGSALVVLLLCIHQVLHCIISHQSLAAGLNSCEKKIFNIVCLHNCDWIWIFTRNQIPGVFHEYAHLLVRSPPTSAVIRLNFNLCFANSNC